MTAPYDLVERLRGYERDSIADPLSEEMYADLQQAAAEIVRLRERVDSMGKDGDQMAADLLREYQRAERAEAERDALRADAERLGGVVRTLVEGGTVLKHITSAAAGHHRDGEFNTLLELAKNALVLHDELAIDAAREKP